MNCLGCYKENVTGYCPNCRKKLFDGKKVSHVLPFKTPQTDNLNFFQQQTKNLSISGVQLKYSLSVKENKLVLTEGHGQFILKPVPPSLIAYPEIAPENEHLTMQIAEQVFGIKVAANALVYFEDGQPAYITKRFDVKADGSHYLQEDFAQLSGKQKKTHGAAYKYNGTYRDIGLLIKKHVAASGPTMEVFFKTILFNYLFSNGDAHLKNFSLMSTDGHDYRLTPAYDLMSTILRTPGETDTALDLFEGDTNTEHYQTYGYYGHPDFMELARSLSIIEIRAKRIIKALANQHDKVASLVNISLLPENIKAMYLRNFQDKVARIFA